jgi:hypothetical protein
MTDKAIEWQPFATAPADGQVIQANRKVGKQDFPHPPSEFRFDAERSCWLQLVNGSWERALFSPSHWASPQLVEAMWRMALELQRRGDAKDAADGGHQEAAAVDSGAKP